MRDFTKAYVNDKGTASASSWKGCCYHYHHLHHHHRHHRYHHYHHYHHGKVTPNEFKYLLSKFGVPLDQKTANEIFCVIDADRSGTLGMIIIIIDSIITIIITAIIIAIIC